MLAVVADEIELQGGIANAGAVTRLGEHVFRPSNPHSTTIHRYLRHLDAAGFDGASVPVGIDDDGRERLMFVEGEVPIVPYPEWAQSDAALVSVVRLMKRFHRASASFLTTPADSWSDEMADPFGGAVVCHNDVCLENVVFRDGEAVALLDFDFAAPGRPLFDLACFARMCVPISDEARVRFGWHVADLPHRLRLVADTYGLDGHQRTEMVEMLSGAIDRGGEFLVRRVRAGDPNFIKVWEEIGGMQSFDRRRAWWAETRHEFDAAMA